MHKPKPRTAAATKVRDKVAVTGHAPAERGRAFAAGRKVALNRADEVLMRQHGTHSNRTFPQPARGFFRRDIDAPPGNSAGAMSEIDAVRAVILARAEQLGLTLTDLSKKIGANQAYLQQFIRRGIPKVLPEDKREAFAALLAVTPDALRGAAPGKGAPRTVAPDAVAQTPEEQEALRIFRSLSAAQQVKALGVLRALA